MQINSNNPTVEKLFQKKKKKKKGFADEINTPIMSDKGGSN